MRISYLEEYVTLAEHGSFTKASRALFISQSTLSDHMRYLEQQTNLHLFNRSAKRFELTESGKMFLQGCQQLLRQYDGLIERCVRTQQGEACLAISVLDGVDLAKLLRAASQQWQSRTGNPFRLKLTRRQKEDPIELLTEGIDDAATIYTISGGPSIKQIANSFKSFKIMSSKMLFWMDASNPLADKPQLTLADLEGVRFYCDTRPKGFETTAMVCESLRKHGINTSPAPVNIQTEEDYLMQDTSYKAMGMSPTRYWIDHIINGDRNYVVRELSDFDLIISLFVIYDDSKLNSQQIQFLKLVERLASKQPWQ